MGRVRCINKKQTFEYGRYKEIEIFPVYSGTHQRVRREKTNESRKAQRDLNKKNRIKKIFRLLNANFGAKDFHLTLTYNEKCVPETSEEALNHYRVFMRKLRNAYSKQNLTLKYMSWYETGVENGRLHHHIIVSGGVKGSFNEVIEFFRSFFPFGIVNVDLLDPSYNDLLSLAEYFAKDPKGKRTFTCSKNLDRTCLIPKSVEHNQTSKAEVKNIIENYEDSAFFEKMYPGYELVTGEIRKNEYSRGAYVYLIMRKKNG